MRIQLLSDLHFERYRDERPLGPADVATEADIVVIAGDIDGVERSVASAIGLFPRTELIVMIGGNHEHYGTGQSIDDGLEEMRDNAKHYSRNGRRVVVLEDEACVVDVRGCPVRFLGSTLWSDFNLYGNPYRDASLVARALNDYRLITGRETLGLLSPAEVRSRHAVSAGFIARELAIPHQGPTVVVTHHLPSARSIAPVYRDDHISAGFASNDDYLVGMGATLWIHGHTHTGCSYRDASGTAVVCNPLGYCRMKGGGQEWVFENAAFEPKLVYELTRNISGRWSADRVP